jgi:hypothetical protein
MKTVTAGFVAAQSAAGALFRKSVYYKRRLWNSSTLVFDWESSWTELAADQIFTVSPINWTLDTDQLNEFKVANVTLVVRDSDNKWRPDNASGIFGIDTASPTYGYDPYFMKFRIDAGFDVSGASEKVTVFTGVATDFQMDSATKTCQILVSGLEAQLLDTRAEAIATTVTSELVGTGNGATTVFTTANPGVGGFTSVTVNGVAKIEGSDFTVSQLNSASLGAKLTFTVAPSNTFPVRASYYYWPQNKAFHELVTLLLTAGGVAVPNQSVQPVIFSNSVLNTFDKATQADFDAGTKTRIVSYTTNSNFDPGSLWSGYHRDRLRRRDQQRGFRPGPRRLTGWTSSITSGTPTVLPPTGPISPSTPAPSGRKLLRPGEHRTGGSADSSLNSRSDRRRTALSPSRLARCAVGATGS